MQAARGTSLSPGDSDPQPPALPAKRARLLIAAVFLLAYAVDQVTKVLAVRHLTGEPDRELIGQVLQLRLIRNPGAAFSAGTAYTEILSCVAIVAVVVVVWLARRVRSTLWAVGFGLLLAGIAGNLTDRLLREPGPLRGHVVDFLMLPNWPIFNVADICINAAAVAIVLQAFRGVHLDGTRQSDADDGTEGGDGERDDAHQPATEGERS
ncbi:signal peptidase II [Nocardioides flavescens]|uniref:Lipoprotein signal peptidase n=1 Tax=Nocardioides flavescens TaxID=2691959 RepID=A0A6L7EYV3_9ACTN|nr:signal peptidase II [Nocardioides flavescens]MXG90848.1 signal peptidase II [Nocardioides flavescens]